MGTFGNFTYEQLHDADATQVNVAKFFGDTFAATTFQKYADFWTWYAAQPPPTPPAKHGDTMGTNVALASSTDLDRSAKLGCKWHRFAYEGEWGSWKTAIPTQIKNAHDRGLSVLYAVMGVPGMGVRAFPTTDAQRQAYADFALFCADSGADIVEFWNEPNNNVFTNGLTPDPSLYSRMTVAAYTRVKATHPKLVCSTGGTAPAPSPLDCVSFDAACKHANADFDSHRDAVAHHPYDWSGSSPITDPVSWNSFAQTVNLHNANPSKPVLITEVGSPSGGGTSGSGEPYTEARQAQWFDLYAQGIDAWPFKPLVEIWHTLSDGMNSQLGGVEGYFGIVRADGSDKPVTAHFRTRVQGTA